MAVTGFVLFLFVIGHLVGNLQFFGGREMINRYGQFLQSNVELLWPVRLTLLALVGLHIWSAVKVSAENKAARPIGYAVHAVRPARFGIKDVILPEQNRADWSEVPEEVRHKLKAHFIRQISELLPLALREK